MLSPTETTERWWLHAETECEACGAPVNPGDVVALDGLTLGAECCAWTHAARVLDPLLVACWTPAEIESGAKEYREALAVLRMLVARIETRVGRES